MKERLLLMLLVLLTVTTFADEKIIGGVGVEDGIEGRLYPWQAKYTIKTPGGAFSCGGSLIAPQWILTAAHCLIRERLGRAGYVRPADLAVDLGSLNHAQLTYPYRVKQIITHPQYNEQTLRHDIALLQLTKPVADIESISLPDKDTLWDKQINHRLKVSGWGKTNNLAEYGANRLNITDLAVVDPKHCQQRYRNFADQQLCVGELAGGKDSCNGDSGGPLFRGTYGNAVQYGVVSYGGKQCAKTGEPAVYTRVADYLDWIQSQIGGDVDQLQIVKEGVSPVVIPNNAPKGKRALLIGINNYYLGGQMNLYGAGRDVANMRNILRQHFDFLPEQILTLKDSQATAKNIRYAVNNWLIKQTGQGDTVWLYFSGHGGFLPDISGDEQTIDAQIGVKADETIFPYDVDILTVSAEQSRTALSYLLTVNHILDDEIKTWTDKLANRYLTVVFDACHSGTANRSIALSQHFKSGIYAMNRYLDSKLKKSPILTTQLKRGTTIPLRNKEIYPNHTFWSAVTSSQRAVDTPQGGVFTTAFIEGINGSADDNHDNDISYSELLAYVDRQSGFDKNPQLEIAAGRLGTSIFSHHPTTPPQAVAEQVLTEQNPHHVQVNWVDSQTGQQTDQLIYCPDVGDPNCQQYTIKVTSDKPGWLLLYELGEDGKLQQYFPNPIVDDQFPNQYSGEISADQPFVFPLGLIMDNRATNQLIAVVLSPEEKANYQRIAQQFVETTQADEGFFYTAINRRDRVVGKDGQLSPWSVSTLKYQAKSY